MPRPIEVGANGKWSTRQVTRLTGVSRRTVAGLEQTTPLDTTHRRQPEYLLVVKVLAAIERVAPLLWGPDQDPDERSRLNKEGQWAAARAWGSPHPDLLLVLFHAGTALVDTAGEHEAMLRKHHQDPLVFLPVGEWAVQLQHAVASAWAGTG